MHPVVVVDQNPRNLAWDAGGDERHVTIDVCVVGRNRIERRLDRGNAKPKGGHKDHDARCSKQHFSRRALGRFSATTRVRVGRGGTC